MSVPTPLTSVDDRLELTLADRLEWAALEALCPHPRYRAVRNVVDRVAGLALCVVLLPVFALIAFAIWLDAGSPIFFRQRRGGRHGQPFTIVKFRTMHTDAPRFSYKVSDGDPRITRVGRLLRRTGLDELPQLWNVVKGDMNLIGPRPEQYALLSEYEPWQLERHVVKPGITGWWQIHHRDSEPMRFNIEKDIEYVRNQSLLLDLRIILGTGLVLLSPLLRRKHDGPVHISIVASTEASGDLVERLEPTASEVVGRL